MFMWIAAQAVPPFQAVEHGGPHNGSRFDFQRIERAGFIGQQIDFVAGLIAPKIERGLASMVCIDLDGRGNDVVFKQGASDWMGEELLAVSPSRWLATPVS